MKVYQALVESGKRTLNWLTQWTHLSSERRVNCWFCNSDSTVKVDENNKFKCPSCEQWNGFDESGDYIEPDPAQYEVKDYCAASGESSNFHTAGNLLCASCSQNQALKVRQLGNYLPLEESSFYEEIESYSQYLERLYRLCPKCESKVRGHIEKQDQTLLGKIREGGEGLVNLLKMKSHVNEEVPRSYVEQQDKPVRHVLVYVLFRLCTLFSIVRMIACSRIVLPFILSRVNAPGQLEALNDILVKEISKSTAETVTDWSSISGPAACLLAMFMAGKHSLYPEDAVHLIVWVVSLVSNADLLSAWTVQSSVGKLALAFLTIIISGVCCLRGRQPRHAPQMYLRKELSPKLYTVAAAKACAKEITSPIQNTPSPTKIQRSKKRVDSALPNIEESVESPVAVDNVRENLEHFSFGLSKSSATHGSIWSLPNIVKSSGEASSPESSPMAPDSTTEEYISLNPRAILSPSRLGFLSFGSRPPSRDSLSSSGPFSTSSRPSSPLANQFNTSRQTSADPIQTTSSLNTAFQMSAASGKTHGAFEPSVSFHSHPNQQIGHASHVSNTAHHTINPGSASLRRNSQGLSSFQRYREQYRHSDDTPQSTLTSPQSNQSMNNASNQAMRNFNAIFGSSSSNEQARMTSNTNKGIAVDTGLKPSSPINFTDKPPQEENLPRRSARIASKGKIPKPWPLKKSWSCSNAYSRDRDELAGSMARLRGENSGFPENADLSCMEIDPCSGDASRVQKGKASLRNSFINSEHVVSRNASRFQDSQEKLRDFFIGPRNVSGSGDVAWLKSGKDSAFHEPLGRGNKSGKMVERRRPQQSMADISDDEVEYDDIGRKKWRRKQEVPETDFSWRWISIGLVIGVSVTTNVFLMLQANYS